MCRETICTSAQSAQLSPPAQQLNSSTGSRSLAVVTNNLSMAVSKRFARLVPKTETVRLVVPVYRPNSTEIYSVSSRVFRFQTNDRCVFSNRNANDAVHSPVELLRKFENITCLQVTLNSSDANASLDGYPFSLKWTASFGAEFKSCTVLRNRGFGRGREGYLDVWAAPEIDTRFGWMISCLLGAFERHKLLKQIVAEHPNVQQVSIGDVHKQGVLYAGRDEILDVRRSMTTPQSSKSEFPNMCATMKGRAVLELLEGFVMIGLSLAVIRPILQTETDQDDEDLLFAFDEHKYGNKEFTEAGKLLNRTVEDGAKLSVTIEGNTVLSVAIRPL